MSKDLELKIEVRALSHGQIAPYKDSEDVYEVTVWTKHYRRDGPSGQWVTVLELGGNRAYVEQVALRAVGADHLPSRTTRDGFWSSYLDYVKHIDVDGSELVAGDSITGIVHIHTVRPYTD
jgi:hypothetical protein